MRDHIEVQALAIRRFADPGRHSRVVSFGRILSEVAERADILGEDAARDAKADLAELTKAVDLVTTFANKEVAHLDRDYATALPDFKPLAEIDAAIEFIGRLWGQWYMRITGVTAPNDAPLAADWWRVLRLDRIEQPWERGVRLAREEMGLDAPFGG